GLCAVGRADFTSHERHLLHHDHARVCANGVLFVRVAVGLWWAHWPVAVAAQHHRRLRPARRWLVLLLSVPGPAAARVVAAGTDRRLPLRPGSARLPPE